MLLLITSTRFLSNCKFRKIAHFYAIVILKIVKTPRGTFSAKPHITTGTTQGKFEVVELKENVFKVIKMKSEINEKNSILDIHENKHIEKT